MPELCADLPEGATWGKAGSRAVAAQDPRCPRPLVPLRPSWRLCVGGWPREVRLHPRTREGGKGDPRPPLGEGQRPSSPVEWLSRVSCTANSVFQCGHWILVLEIERPIANLTQETLHIP